MKINWKTRFRNKTFVVSFTAACLAFVYQILGMFGVVPPVTQDTVQGIIGLLINLLVGLGVIINPTTEGVSD